MTTASNSNPRRLMIITSDEKIIEQIRSNNSASLYETIILEPGENENNLSNILSPNDRQSRNPKKTKNNSLICVVCGSVAFGRNFGVIACESCKLFFRRNGLRNPATLACRLNNECEIKSDTRRRCLACRLNKCLNSGMKRDRLLKAEEKTMKRYKTNQQASQSSSTTYPDHVNHTSFTLHERIFPEWPVCQSSMLTPRDFQRVEAIRVAFEKRIELASHSGFPWNPSTYATNLPQHLNARSIPAMRLLAFFKQIPEFNQLNIDDKMILIKYNLMSLVILNCALSFNINSQQILEVDTDVPWNSSILRSVHGDEVHTQITKIFEPLVRIAKLDQKIIHLLLIVLILTKGLSTGGGAPEPILNDHMAVYKAQNLYTELLWKYLETIYGSDQAFHIFNNLITRFLTWQLFEKKLRDNVEETFSSSVEVELSPLMKALFHTY